MTRSATIPWRALLAMLLVTGTAFPVRAQGQSPDSPRQRPQTGGTGLGSGSQPPGPREGSSLGTSRRRETPQNERAESSGAADREQRRRGESDAPREGGGERRGETREGGADAQGAERREPREGRRESGGGESGGAAARTVGGGGSGGGGSGGRKSGGGGSSGGSSGSGGGSFAVGTVGDGTFEPVLLREPEYGEAPDEGDALTLVDGSMSLGDFLSTISLATTWNIIVSEEAKGLNLNFWINEVKPKQALDILKFHKVFYTFDTANRYLYVMTEQEWLDREFGKVEAHEFEIKNADIAYMESVITSLLSAKGRIISDQRTGRVYVWDTRDNLDHMIKTVEELDVPLDKATFAVRDADLGDIEAAINALLTPSGSILSDPRTAQLFVWDTPAALERMRAAVAELDVPLDTRRYDLVNIDAENVIDSLEALVSERGLIQVDPRFNSLMITDLPGRIARMEEAIANLDRELETRTWTINYADIDFVADQIEIQIPSEMGEVVVNEEVHQVTVSGLKERLDRIDALLKTWDIRRKQVNIEAYIVSMGSDIERNFSINWNYFGIAGMAPVTVRGGSGFDPESESGSINIGQLPYNIPAYGDLQLDDGGEIVRPVLTNTAGDPVVADVRGNRLGVTLDYLDQKDLATVLASPRVTVQDGEEAIFENARRVPFISSSSYYNTGFGGGNNNNSGFYPNNTNRVEFIDVGTILLVTPRITEDQNILLDISAEDSDAEQVIIISNGEESTVPEKTTRRAETQLRVASGDTIVMGGLRRDASTKSESKTPILGDIPLIGRLFRYPNDKSSNRNLIIFITPTIIDEYTRPEADVLAQVDEKIASDHRHNLKKIWGRWRDKIRQGRNEVSVAIGQSGAIHSEGQRVAVDELRDAFFAAKKAGNVTVIVRSHPEAPEDVVAQVTEAALEAGIKVEFEERALPLVPSAVPRSADGTPLARAK